jgi:hypothetical protein
MLRKLGISLSFISECILFPVFFIMTFGIRYVTIQNCRSQWPRGLMRRSAAARLLRSWVRIPRRAWIFVCCECCVLLGKGLCDELITRPEESYLLWCVVVCDLETSRMRRPWPALGRSATNIYMHIHKINNIYFLFCIVGNFCLLYKEK